MDETLMTAEKGKRPGPPTQATAASTGTSLAAALRSRFGLSRMEALVACALADGLTYQEIADRSHVSYHTVHSHVKAIHRKAGVPSNTRLLALIRKMEAV
jgi:DNA-binding CsgD family transcriptional regulator